MISLAEVSSFHRKTWTQTPHWNISLIVRQYLVYFIKLFNLPYSRNIHPITGWFQIVVTAKKWEINLLFCGSPIEILTLISSSECWFGKKYRLGKANRRWFSELKWHFHFGLLRFHKLYLINNQLILNWNFTFFLQGDPFSKTIIQSL